MNLDDMKERWRDRNDKLADQCFEELAADVKARSARFEATIVRRDWIEAVAAIVVLIGLGLFLWFNAVPPVMTLGVAIVMLAAIEIILVMFWARHRDSRPQQDSSMLEFSKAELARLDRQIGLLRKISWWYSVPLLLGCAVFIYGLLLAAPQLPRLTFFGVLVGSCLCFLWTGNIIHRGNQRAVKTELIPLRDQIAEFLKALTPAPTDGDDVSSIHE